MFHWQPVHPQGILEGKKQQKTADNVSAFSLYHRQFAHIQGGQQVMKAEHLLCNTTKLCVRTGQSAGQRTVDEGSASAVSDVHQQ